MRIVSSALKGPFCQPSPKGWVTDAIQTPALKGPFTRQYAHERPLQGRKPGLAVVPRPVGLG